MSYSQPTVVLCLRQAMVFLSVAAWTLGLAHHPDINLPAGGAALALLFFFLKLNPTKKYTFAQLRETFDWPGL